MLSIDGLSAGYGKVRALWDVSLTVGHGEIVAVLGANGAGKSTLVRCIVGLVRADAGTILLADHRIEDREPHEISALGVAYGPEGGGLFRDMSVRENLEMGAYHRPAWFRRADKLERVMETFPRLAERQHNLARTLSGGERQMLVLARALMSEPRLCILDEPSIGLAPLFVDELFRTVEQLRSDGITVLLIEQNVARSLEIADRGYVLENGRVVGAAPADELLADERIGSAYLGL